MLKRMHKGINCVCKYWQVDSCWLSFKGEILWYVLLSASDSLFEKKY